MVSGLQMISGGLDEAQNHILSPYRWVYIGTGFLSFWVIYHLSAGP